MPGLVEMKAGESSVFIAISGEPEVAAVASLDERIETVVATLRDKFKVIRQISHDLVDSLKDPALPVKTAEVEFGLGITGKGTVYVVETTLNASFKIKLTLDLAGK